MINIQTSETMPFAARYNYNISLILGEVAKTTFVDTSQSECSIGGKEPTFKVAANKSAPIILPPSAVRRAGLHHKFGQASLLILACEAALNYLDVVDCVDTKD